MTVLFATSVVEGLLSLAFHPMLPLLLNPDLDDLNASIVVRIY